MNRDTLIGVAGSCLLVAAMVVVFVYERANAQVLEDDEDHLTASIAQSSLSGAAAVGGSDTKTANITAVGPSNVTFTLTWNAAQGSDTLKLSITPPSGSEIAAKASANEDDESITVIVPVPADYMGQGLWSVKVDFVSAEPASLPGGISPPAGGMTDSSVSYTVAIAFT